MKVTTDPLGVTTVELSPPDRSTLARAKTLAEQVAFHLRDTNEGDASEVGNAAREVADGIARMLAPEDAA